MFLKPVHVKKQGKKRTYWKLVESHRTPRGPRHRTVAYLGELGASERSGWARLGRSLAGEPEPAYPLFAQLEASEPVPATVEINVRSVRVERSRRFGDVYLGLVLWRTLGFDDLFARLLPAGREDVPWGMVAAIVTISRFCNPSSELHIADDWYRSTALEQLINVAAKSVGKDRLYRAHDRVLPLKEAIEIHLKKRFTTLFDAKYDLLLYDVTSTYFEGEAAGNEQAQRGHSRDKRSDCKQVCIGLVVTREGLPVAYEVFDGNRNDVTTVEEIVEAMEAKYGQAERIWVLDRGMVNSENLSYISERQGHYIVGSSRETLKSYEAQLVDEADWTQVQEGLEVKLCDGPDGEETFVLCRSTARREKEKAMHERFEKRIEEGLARLARRLERAKRKPNVSQVERQIGRLLERNSRSAGLFNIQVDEVERDGRPGLAVHWTKNEAWRCWAALSEGCYMLRTNLTGWAPADLWKTYIQLTEAEAAFRTQKSELSLRPVWHQLKDRVQAHILFSFLAYAMWKTLQQWMGRSDLGHAPRTMIDELARITLNDVILPTSAGRHICMQCVSDPDERQRVLLSRLGLKLPQRLGEPRWIKDLNVVPNSR
jgi:transposase